MLENVRFAIILHFQQFRFINAAPLEPILAESDSRWNGCCAQPKFAIKAEKELFELAKVLGKRIEPEISGSYRVGDIRHCFPDISLARKVLGYKPAFTLEEGMRELAEWLDQQTADDRFNEMRAELTSRGLVV